MEIHTYFMHMYSVCVHLGNWNMTMTSVCATRAHFQVRTGVHSHRDALHNQEGQLVTETPEDFKLNLIVVKVQRGVRSAYKCSARLV